MNYAELRLHIAIADFLRLNEAPGVWAWFHVPNGEKRDKRAAAKLKAMGLKPGVPDIVIDHGGRIAYVEIKGRGSLSQAQKEWRGGAIMRGAGFYTIRSVQEMADMLDALGIRCRARLSA